MADMPQQRTMEIDIPRELAGLVIGKNGSTIRGIEEATGAKLHVKTPEGGGRGRTYVVVVGGTVQAKEALAEVKAVVAKVDETIAEHLGGEFTGPPTSAAAQPVEARRENPRLRDRYIQNSTAQEDTRWSYEDMTAELVVSAHKPAFKCLSGRGGENLKKIQEQCKATIEVQDHHKAGDMQHAFLSGGIEDVVFATEMVKESLEWYVPDRDAKDRSKRQDLPNAIDLKVIKAEAEIKIKGSAAGLVIGKNGCNIKSIKSETNVWRLEVDNEADGEGYKYVRAEGLVTPVLKAIAEVQNKLKNYSQGHANRGAFREQQPNNRGQPMMPSASPPRSPPPAARPQGSGQATSPPPHHARFSSRLNRK